MTASKRQTGPQHGNNEEWPKDQVAVLTKMWIEGKSATEISRVIKGRTRSAVIGKIHRLGLDARRDPNNIIVRPPYVKKTATASTVKVSAPRPAPPKPGPQNKPAVIFGKVSVESPEETLARRAKMSASGQATIAEVESATNDNTIRLMDRRTFQCSWPVGVPERPADQMCCGQTVPQGGPRATPSYCPAHSWMAIGSQPKRAVPTEPSVIRRAA